MINCGYNLIINAIQIKEHSQKEKKRNENATCLQQILEQIKHKNEMKSLKVSRNQFS